MVVVQFLSLQMKRGTQHLLLMLLQLLQLLLILEEGMTTSLRRGGGEEAVCLRRLGLVRQILVARQIVIQRGVRAVSYDVVMFNY